MRIMVASDLHGSAFYTRKVLEAFEREGADKLLLLGDILYHGPRNPLTEEYSPKDVAAMLNEKSEDILAVRGNCDSEVDQMVLDFPMMSDSLCLWLGSRMVYATHGHIYNEQILPKLHKGDILLHGHNHLAGYRMHEDYIYMNPGSVSLPKEDTWRGYMILTEDKAEWKTLDGGTVEELKLD